MPYYNDIYRPDFQAELLDIEPMPEDEQEQPDFLPLASALKRRMMKRAVAPIGMEHSAVEIPKAGHEGLGGGMGGGKMSL